MEEADNSKKKEPGTWMSFLVFGIAIAIILTGVVILEFDVHIVLLLALIFVCVVSATLGYSFDDLVEFMKKSLGQAMSAMIIFIFIGVIIASWIFSGTVQTLIYYGLQYISPAVFLPVGLLLCSLTSMSIGTSWGTIGTMGIAMMGIGSGMGIPPAVTAGMVISGSFFGDKMSPISDTTNLAPASAGTTLYKHISAMWKTTLPAYIISFIIFVVIGLAYQDGEINTETVAIFSDTIRANFKISPILLLPMIVLLVLNLMKFPAIPGMVIGSLLGVILAITVQGVSVGDVIAGLNYGYVKSTGVDVVDTLLCRGGIQNMMYTFSLSCIAISFGGVMEHVGYLRKIIAVVIKGVKKDALMVPLVIASTTLGTLTIQNSTFSNGIRTFLRCNMTSATVSVTNCTFYKVCSYDGGSNNNGLFLMDKVSTSTGKLTVEKCVFSQIGVGTLGYWAKKGKMKAQASYSKNYYHNSANLWDATNGLYTDPSACNATEIDPKFTNPESGDFTVGAEDIKDSKAGDPRWIKE